MARAFGRLVIGALASVGLWQGCGSPTVAMVAPDAGARCEVVLVTGDVPGGAGPGVGAFLPGGQGLSPAGKQVAIGGFPFGLAAVPNSAKVIVGDSAYGEERLRVVDTATGMVLSEQVVASHFLGLAVSANGRVVYASSPNDSAVLTLDLDAAGNLSPLDKFAVRGYPAGLALSPDGRMLYVALQLTDEVVVLEADFGFEIARIPVGSRPYQVVAAPGGGEAYVTLWGGGGVAVVDPLKAAPVATIVTGKNPSGEAVSADGQWLYVANTDDDSVSKIDILARKLVATRSVHTTLTSLLGHSPGDVALSSDGSRLYVAAAGANAVLSLDGSDLHRIGAIPMGWYPTSVAALANGTVVVANGKGVGIGPNLGGAYLPLLMRGTLSLLASPGDAQFVQGSPRVEDNNARPATREAQVRCTGDAHFPISASAGAKFKSPIEHVVLLVRENKTYDAELGDLETGNGDPSLTLFGEKYTPNLHALARQFTSLDNFHSNAEASIQGHEWTTAATANDFIEKAWFTQPGYRADLRPNKDLTTTMARPSYGSIFEVLEAQQVDFVVWGEVVGFRSVLGSHFDGNFPGLFFNLDIPDVEKAAYVVRRIRDEHVLPPFSYLLLPRNHTYGTLAGKPTPITMVADNDLATGRVIDAISHSSFWASTVVFLIEDDPQDGGDHVEAHRSICLVISPWARRGATVSAHFDVASLYRTIELILRVPPMNQGDAQAAAMIEAFTDRPDLRPFTSVPSNFPKAQLNGLDAPLGEESAKMNFSEPDRAAGLGRVLWRAMKGEPPPWPTSTDDDE